MITTKLEGGLGNQMFQYAAGRSLAHRHNTSLRLDATWFNSPGAQNPRRVFELECFELSNVAIEKGSLASKLAAYLKAPQTTLTENVGSVDKRFFSAPSNAQLIGFWQSEDYFKTAGAEVRKDFTFKSAPSSQDSELVAAMAKQQSVSMHVRRGDYLGKTEYHGLAGLEYYHRGMDYLKSKLKNPVFYVFSDDIPWCRKHLKSKNITFVDHHDASRGQDDMRLMASCKHHITANSSLSWWGAWLNPNQSKIVITPKLWYADPGMASVHPAPKGWVKL